MPHQVGADGIGGYDLVARDEGVAHAALAVPLTTPLTCRGVDDIEARVGNARQIGEHVGQPDCVVEVCAHASLRRDRGCEAKQVLCAKRDSHEEVVLHLGNGDDLICFAEAAAERVALEHAAASRHVVLGEGGQV